MIRAEDFSIGDSVLINGVPRVISAITKRKVGYHINPKEPRLHYARLSEVNARPLSYKIVSTLNHFSGRYFFIYWDDKCEDCDHQYYMVVCSHGFPVRYCHEVMRIARVFDIKQCVLDGYYE